MVYVPKYDVAKLNNRHIYIIYYIILILYESASLLLYIGIYLRKRFRVSQNDIPTKTILLPAA